MRISNGFACKTNTNTLLVSYWWSNYCSAFFLGKQGNQLKPKPKQSRDCLRCNLKTALVSYYSKKMSAYFKGLCHGNRELKQPRRRRQQKPHKFAYLTMKNSIFARFARAFFIFLHFVDVLVLSTT